ncbi:MAG: hypothetical protein O2804_02660 [Verrucomicrobia bacterium]|nr:hypothetical protein [Verrucomicrobiota bacterium]
MPFPSALPFPNEYTYFGALLEEDFLALEDFDLVGIGKKQALRNASKEDAWQA